MPDQRTMLHDLETHASCMVAFSKVHYYSLTKMLDGVGMVHRWTENIFDAIRMTMSCSKQGEV